ncbi:MAG: hypothetical protein ABR947_02610 [Solirubrobacteraceae bacterium]|jgi:hypothetical protein
MGTLIVAATFTAAADAKKPHKPPKPAQKQSEPKPTKELLANCDSIIALTEVSSLTGLNLTAPTAQPAISVQSVAGLCSGSYVLDGTVNGGVQGTVSTFGITIQGQKLTGGPINATATAASMYEKDVMVAEAQDQACPGTAVYPTPITGIGTEAFAAGPCTATAPESIIAVDGPVVVTVGWQNLTATGGVSVGEAEPVISHVFEAVGL